MPTGLTSAQRQLVKAIYDALHKAWPFPDDVRIFLREWPLDSVSRNGLLGSEPARPVLTIHAPQGAETEVERTFLQKINSAVALPIHFRTS